MLHRRARCTARPGADAPARGGPAAPAAEGSAHRPPLCPGDRRNAPVTDRKDTRPGRPLVAWRHRAFRGGGDGAAVPKVRRGLDEDFKSGAVRLVFETGKPMAQVARELGVNEGTLGNWVAVARHQRVGGDGPLSEDEWAIRSWRPRSATWSGSICTRRPRRWCCAWMRNRSCRRWSAPPRCSPSGPARRSGPASTTSGTAPPRCSPHSRWPPAGSPTPAPNGTAPGVRRPSAPGAAAYPRRELHVVVDNYATHNHPAVRAWPPRPPRVPAGAPALHADLGLLAEPGRGVLLDHHPPGPAPRQLPHRRRPDRRDSTVHRRLERPVSTVHLDQGPRHRHRQSHRPATPQGINHVSYGA